MINSDSSRSRVQVRARFAPAAGEPRQDMLRCRCWSIDRPLDLSPLFLSSVHNVS